MFRRRRKPEDFTAEIQSHLELEEQVLRSQGMSKVEARAAARRAFGNPAAAAERFYESSPRLWWDHLLHDLRFALRGLARRPGFAVAATLILALGIGATSAIFSAADDALFRPFPLPNPQQLAQIYSFNQKAARFVSTSYPDYQDFRRRSHVFRQLAAYVRLPLNVSLGGRAERISIEAVTGNYFAMLELPPLIGRALGESDDAPGPAPAAMIGETLWRERFGSRPSILGQTVMVEDQPFRIVGVVPRRYTGINLNWDETPQVWIPIHASPLVVPGFRAADVFRRRDVPWLVIAGRLKPGYSIAAAHAALQTVAASLARSDAADRDLTAVVYELSRSKFWPSYRGSVTLGLLVFAAAAGLVLLLACANVSNLLLQRALHRRREFAIRLALGARPSRLIRQFLAENLLLSACAFVAALAVAEILGRILQSLPNAFGLPLTLDLGIQGRVLAFCAAVSLGAAFLFGLAPALQALRPDLIPALQKTSPGSAGGRDVWHHALVVFQVAFCVTLLAAGGLFARTLAKAYALDPGFHPANLLLIEFNLTQSQTGSVGKLRAFEENLPRRLVSLPGIDSAVIADAPLIPTRMTVSIDNAFAVEFNAVGPGFFRTAGISLLRGREFVPEDRDQSPRVVVVNQSLAQRLAPGGEALGKTIRLSNGPPAQIVGIAADSKYHTVWESPQPHVYEALLQTRILHSTAIVRTRRDPAEVIPAIRREWDRLLPGVQLLGIHTGREQVDRSLARERAAAGFLGGFALLAVVLAFSGLFASMAYSVSARTREIGIRMALGARPQIIARQVLRQALCRTALGVAAGVLLSLPLARLMASQIRGVSPADPAVFTAVALLVAMITAAAAWLPARRAASIDPAQTLK